MSKWPLGDKVFATYDDVLIMPQYSDVVPDHVQIETYVTRNIQLKTPVISAAMDTVTESAMAIAIARQGGIGVIHRNMSPDSQVAEVKKVKRLESRFVSDPYTLSPNQTLEEARQLMDKHGVSGLPVTDKDRILVGIITQRDVIGIQPNAYSHLVKQRMTSEKLITVSEGILPEKAKAMLHEHRIEKLPIVDKAGKLIGLITLRDLTANKRFPLQCKDDRGRLRVTAALGTSKQDKERATKLAEANVDAFVLDTAHGHSKNVIDMLTWLKKNFPEIDVLAGNVVTAEGALSLIQAGADGIKVGMGPGSICTTRVIAGCGVPQITAIQLVSEVCSKENIPLCADGGIKHSGDLAKALAAGANNVMVGNLLAGCDEAPGELVYKKGRAFKTYRGMGSLGAMVNSFGNRYDQDVSQGPDMVVPEGIEGHVPYRGSVHKCLFQIFGGIRAAMGYSGCKTLSEFHERAQLIRISPSSLWEGHPHNVDIVREAPNYYVG